MGRSFGEALAAYDDASVIGLLPAGGTPHLNPPWRPSSDAGDRLIVIAADDDQIHLASGARRRARRIGPAPGVRARTRARADARPRLEPSCAGDPPRARRVRRRTGSETVVVATGGRRVPRTSPRLEARLTRPADRRSGAAIRATGPMLDDLARRDTSTTSSCSATTRSTRPGRDARTLITLLHLRDIASRLGPRLLDRQRDARPAQSGAGRGRPRRRLHRQRPADQPDDRPGGRVEAPQCRVRRPVRPGGLGDLPEAGRRLRCARRPPCRSRPSSRPRAGAARSPSATGSSPGPRTRQPRTACR